MPRHVRVLEGVYAMYEDIAFALGDAEDFIKRNQAEFSDWVDAVAADRMSAQEAKRRMNQEWANASKEIEEARKLTSGNARRAGFTHLHDSLRMDEQAVPVPAIPIVRLVVPFPEGA